MVLQTLDAIRRKDDILVLGYVVMPNHVHLLLRVKGIPIDRVLRDLKSRSGYAISKNRNKYGSVWQKSYFDFICRKPRDVGNKLKYIHENPVEAGLVARPSDWKWSSYRHYLETGTPPISVDFLDLSGDPDRLLWPAPWRRL